MSEGTVDSERAVVASISLETIADAIERIGFSCTDCGACCRSGDDGEDHVATVFPAEGHRLERATGREWAAVVRPMPFGLDDDGTGETFEWALQTDDCGDCVFFDEAATDGGCRVYADRPGGCQTYPFQLAPPGRQGPATGVVDTAGPVEAFECEGLGEPISRERALALAAEVKAYALESLDQERALLERYEPSSAGSTVVVHDSEGPKAPDGTVLE